jgi:methionyl-tRNA formyltransferase
MRIILCTERDLAGCLVMNEMLPSLRNHEVLTLVSDKRAPLVDAPPELAYLQFVQWDLPIEVLFPMIDATGLPPGPLVTFRGATGRFGQIELVSDVNDETHIARIASFEPDVIISARFSFLFEPSVFCLARYGAFNIHPGVLPRYAGRYAPLHALIEGETRLGCTLHIIDEGIDSGAIIGIGYLPANRRRSLLWHILRSYRPGIELCIELLARLERGEPVDAMPQDRTQRRYLRFPSSDDLTSLTREWPLFDFAEYAEILQRFLPLPWDSLLSHYLSQDLFDTSSGYARLA